MFDISGYGLKIQLRASVTFPAGITLSQFSDDVDPFDIPSIQEADKAMGVNGDLIVWSKASPIIVNIAVVPTSDDDRNLAVLLEANRVSRGKTSARDIITLTAIYPDSSSLTLTSGKITDGMPGNAVAGTGRTKTKTYGFCFEGRIGT